jgi:drug/metabolite transporter (DMT)-like permease
VSIRLVTNTKQTIRPTNFSKHNSLWRTVWFVGISLIPLAEVFAIEYIVPIWTMVFAAPILGERLTAMRMLIVTIGFTGVLVILPPGAEIVDTGAIAVIGAAICYAMAHVLTKKLTSTDSTLAIYFI